MRKSFCIIIVSVFCLILQAQNHFVYLRFDESTNEVSKIKNKLNQIANATTDTFLLYYDHVEYDRKDFVQLVSSKTFLNNLTLYEPMQEHQELNNIVQRYLVEYVDEDGLIQGRNDRNWHFTFILSKYTSKDDLIRWLDINNFRKRDILVDFIMYDEYTYLDYTDLTEFVSESTYMLNF